MSASDSVALCLRPKTQARGAIPSVGIVRKDGDAEESVDKQAAKLAMAEWCLNTSRLGNRLLHEGAMGDPSFYILISAFIGELRQDPPIIKGIALENGISQSTVMRWVNILVEKAMVYRRSDPIDLRRTCIELTPGGRQVVTHFLDILLSHQA